MDRVIETIENEIRELSKLVVIWSKDPQDSQDRKMYEYYKEGLNQHIEELKRLTQGIECES